jgi:phage terminase large subunit GpA-like protein
MTDPCNDFRVAIAPPSDLMPAEWCRCVPVENSERGKYFDPSQTRWLIKPMNHYADYVTRHMTCIFPTGAGKSTFFEAIGCWIVSQSPGSYLYASQTDATGEQWLETRFLKSLKGCEPINPLWPANARNTVRKDAIIWPHMFQLFGGANISNFQEVSITYGCGDEAWKWKKGMVREWLGRHHNRENRKFVLVSQAGQISSEDGIGETDELHQEYDKGRLWEFSWKCPECGDVHPFAFEQLKHDTIEGDEQASADTARRVCPSCSNEFPDTVSVRRMLHDSLQENDGYVLTRGHGLRGHESFHLDAGAIWWIPWADDVLQKIEADRQMAMGDHTNLMKWTQKRRAKGWDMSKSVIETQITPSDYSSADYVDGRMIEGEQIRFATVDAGADHYWLRIRSWAAGGDSLGLKATYIGTEDDLAKTIDDYKVPAQCVFVDVGYDQERIAELCLKYGWRGIKGDGNRKQGWEWMIQSGPRKGQKETRLYGPKYLAKAVSGRRCEVWPVATEPLQYILQRLIEGKGVRWEVESDAPPSYPKHLNGEKLVTKRDARGQDIPKWTRFGANHFRDTEIYQLAAALMAGAFRPSRQDEAEASKAMAEE